MHCPTKNQHLFGHERCCFFSVVSLPPKRHADEIREVFRRFLHVETEPKFHWLAFEMMHAELPEGRLMVVKRSSPRNPLVVSLGHRFDRYSYSYGFRHHFFL